MRTVHASALAGFLFSRVTQRVELSLKLSVSRDDLRSEEIWRDPTFVPPFSDVAEEGIRDTAILRCLPLGLPHVVCLCLDTSYSFFVACDFDVIYSGIQSPLNGKRGSTFF